MAIAIYSMGVVVAPTIGPVRGGLTHRYCAPRHWFDSTADPPRAGRARELVRFIIYCHYRPYCICSAAAGVGAVG
jgi:hypothetical protein